MKGSYLGVGRRVAALLLALLVVAGGALTGTPGRVPKIMAEGANLVVNGTFDDGVVTAWTAGGSTTRATAYKYSSGGFDYLLMAELTYFGAAVTNDNFGRCLVITDTVTGNGRAYVTQTVAVTTGQWYLFRFLHRNGVGTSTSSGEMRLGTSAQGSEYRSWTSSTSGDNLGNDTRFVLHWHRFKATSSTVYITLYTQNDTAGAYNFFDSIELVSTPEKVTNNSLESNTNGWSFAYGTGAIVGGGQAGNCVQVTSNSPSYYAVIYQDIATTVGTYYTLDAYVKAGNSAVHASIGSMDEVFTSTSWTRVRYNFRATSTSTHICFFAVDCGVGEYFYVDEVFVYESRDEVQAAYNTRASALLNWFSHPTEGGTNWNNWYAHWVTGSPDDSEAYARVTAQVAHLYAWKWAYSATATDILTATKALDALYQTRDGTGSSERWGMRWLSGVIGSEAGFSIHWLWPQLTAQQKTDYKTMLTSEAITYTVGPVAYARDYPYYSLDTGQPWANVYWKCAGYTGTLYADLAAYYYDPFYRTACEMPYEGDTKAESALAYGILLAQCAEYWPNDAYAAAWKRYAKMIHALAISWDQDYTDDNGHQWNDYRNVATSNLALGNHGWYPNPVYSTSVLRDVEQPVYRQAIQPFSSL